MSLSRTVNNSDYQIKNKFKKTGVLIFCFGDFPLINTLMKSNMPIFKVFYNFTKHCSSLQFDSNPHYLRQTPLICCCLSILLFIFWLAFDNYIRLSLVRKPQIHKIHRNVIKKSSILL